ncbi:50S ribosomal protein L3 [Candidatus Woesearchaeota archaeon]|nr:50S ribosomal protein L3 [Candidatus Woesearchaeota archaeon]
MARAHSPRSGSLQYWHRVRAKRIYPRIRSWFKDIKELKILGFAGYKVGMTHIIYKNTNPNSPLKNELVSIPATVLECPPLKTYSIRFYKNTDNGLQLISEILSTKLDKELSRKINIPKKQKEKNLDEILSKTTEVRICFYTQPKLIKLKKNPEIFEISLSGNNPRSQYEFAKALLDREIRIQEIFRPGQFVDIHAVTKGKGLQGAVKRFGVTLKSHKSEKKRRSAGNLGAWTPKKVSFRVPQKGQMGFHNRTDYNKQILEINSNPEKINPKDGFPHYGLVKSDYILIKGSVLGPQKRLIRLSEAFRNHKIMPMEINYISLESKQ